MAAPGLDRRCWTRVLGLAALCLALLFSGAGASEAAPPEEGGETGAAASSGGGADSGDGGEAGETKEPSPSADELLAKRLRTRAKHVQALIAGELDPAVSVSELFTIDLRTPELAGAEGAELKTLLERVHAASRAPAGGPEGDEAKDGEGEGAEPPALPGPDADALTRARAELARAYWQFLTLPPEQRAERISVHRRSQERIREAAAAEKAARARLARMKREAEQLAALMAGELDVEIDPEPLLRVDLSADGELGRDPDRLARALGHAPVPPKPATLEEGEPSERGGTSKKGKKGKKGKTPEPEPAPEPTVEPEPEWAPSPELAKQLAEAAGELDRQRLKFLALSVDEREALLKQHAARQARAEEKDEAVDEILAAEEASVAEAESQISEAEDAAAAAAAEREQALRAAAQARSEAIRRLAEERARLLGVKESHALYRAELTRKKQADAGDHEVALELDRRAGEQAQKIHTDEVEAAADAMYGEVREALEAARERLRETLDAIATGESEVMAVGEPLAGLPSDIDRGEISELRAELEASEEELRALELEQQWATATRQRDDIVMLNAARLTLLGIASDELRGRMTGFGADGVRQVRREIDQIVLELRYRFLTLPRLGRTLVDSFETSPLPVLFGLVKFGVVIVLFRYWRRRAEPTLERMRDHYRKRTEGNARVNAAIATGLWYLQHIRKPLEWLALFAVLFGFVISQEEILELEILWLVLLWLLVGTTVILLIDGIAARENLVYGRGTTRTADLRIRSLRLVGLTIVITGLVLSLTAELVGRGAIHRWVRILVWGAALPILFVLIRWWRDHVFRRFREDEDIPDNALSRWIRANTTGGASFPAATLAGAYLFGRGFARWTLHRATDLEATRRLLAWLFRREVARQANARREDESEQVSPLPPEIYEQFDPNRAIVPPAPITTEDKDKDKDKRAAGVGPPPEDRELSVFLAEEVAADQLREVVELKMAHRGTLSAVIGERGSGKSSFLRRLAAELEARAEDYQHEGHEDEKAEAEAGDRHAEYGRLTVRRIQCPPGGFRQLLKAIADSVGLSRNAPAEEVVEALSEQTPLVFLIDDAHRLVRPAIGGLDGLDKFADFARQVSGDASWIASIGAAAWQYVSRARGERVFFDQIVKLPAWTEQEIGALIRARTTAAAVEPSFADIVIPRQFDVATVGDTERRPSETERAELGFYRILWDYAKGNPAVALHFWRESLVLAKDEREEVVETKVRLFKEPAGADLDEVGATLHFVLRAVVQLEVASQTDLVACTQLPPSDVADALRFAVARGWIAQVRGERYRVTWHWYRAITNMLRRQHLLAI